MDGGVGSPPCRRFRGRIPLCEDSAMNFLLRVLLGLVVVALAFVVTARIIPGIQVHGGVTAYLLVAVVFGLVNGILGPVLRLVTLPISILTLGLFLLLLTARLLPSALTIDGFLSAFIGAILIGLVSWVLNHLLAQPLERALRPR